jgi:FkbM family methyltransferase
MISKRDLRLHLVHRLLKIRLHSLVERDVPLIRLGSELAGWWIPADVARPGAVAYLAGAGEDITFDRELLARGVQVTTFDPTPKAIAHVESLGLDEDNFRFVAVGWWDEAAELQFHVPQRPDNPNLSIIGLNGSSASVTAPVKPVKDLMAELDDSDIDIMKIDIEGAEYRVLDSLLGGGILPGVLCVEFDQPQPPARTVAMVQRLRSAGYRLVHIDFFDYTFDRRPAARSQGF